MIRELKLPIKELPSGWKTVLIYQYIQNKPIYCYVYDTSGSCVRVEFDKSTRFEAHFFATDEQIEQGVKRWERDGAKDLEAVRRDLMLYKPVNYFNHVCKNIIKNGEQVRIYVSDDVYFKGKFDIKEEYKTQIAKKLDASPNPKLNKFAKEMLGKSLYYLMMNVSGDEEYEIHGSSDEDYPTVCGFGFNTLTPEGHAKWDSILKSYIIKQIWFTHGDYPNFYVESKKYDGGKLNEFEYCLAGYCSSTLYDKWFASSSMSGRRVRARKTDKRTTTKKPVARKPTVKRATPKRPVRKIVRKRI